MEVQKTIPNFFCNRSVFVTGGTGFMGKVLIEKLLRTCPDIDYIYVLMRSKRGKHPNDRLKDVFDLPLFDIIRAKDCNIFKKVKPICGCVSELGLGISDEDRKTLEENVSVVFHLAASVRFDDPIRKAIFINVRGTREVVNLALKMENLSVFVHVSTTYCNLSQPVVEETVYPIDMSWQEMILVAETMTEDTLKTLTSKTLGDFPNTYTFTKGLAEHIIDDYKDMIPAIIFRPSIVISTMKDPFFGWVDNFNGPIGIIVAAGKGISRTMFAKGNVECDYIPVDVVINGLIIATWQKGLARKISEVSVYQSSSCDLKRITIQGLIDIAINIGYEIPLEDCIWIPKVFVTPNALLYYIAFFILQVIPAVFIDMITYLLGRKPILLKIQRKIFAANIALNYFMSHDWKFKNKNFLELENLILPSDYEKFSYNIKSVDTADFLKKSAIGAKKFLLKEKLERVPKARRHLNMLYVADRILNAVLITFMLWFSIPVLYKLLLYFVPN